MNKIKLVVPPEKISTCQTILRHEFKDTLHCIRALQASGHWLIWEGHEMSPEPKNDRVAVLGDVIAKLILCEKWHATNHDKGDWSKIERRTLSNEYLSEIGFRHKLDSCVLLNDGTTSVSDKTMATTVEALFGAVYLDAGKEALGKVLVTLGITSKFMEVATSLKENPTLFRD